MFKIFTFLIITFSITVCAQSSGEIIYISKNKVDSYIEEKFALTFEKNISRFAIQNRIYTDKIIKSENDNEIIVNNTYPDSLYPKYFIDNLKKSIIFTKPVSNDDYKTFRNFIVKDDLKLNWIIKSDTMKISNLKCQMATLIFRGRKYTAWFSTEYSIPFGPFKFYGLPGLIISLEDELKEVSYFLKSIKFNDQTIIKEYNSLLNSDFINIAEFNIIQEQARKDSQDEFQRLLLTKLGRGATIKKSKTQNVNIELNFDN